MQNSYEALSMILDSLAEHVVVIDKLGDIQYVNKKWSSFNENNTTFATKDWSGVNYLTECDKAAEMGDNFGVKARNGIQSVISEEQPVFNLEYPCHSPDEKRWFIMRVTSFKIASKDYFVISHQDITERKLAEEEVKNLVNLDGLTNIPNRRAFDAFLASEWNRCSQLEKPMSLVLIDLDHFKLLNDNYGHQFGDHCLIKVGELLTTFAKRPSDLCARYGGEEFVIIWGNTSLAKAKELASKLLNSIIALNIPNKMSPIASHLTASIGISTVIPINDNCVSELISKADEMLYLAKETGKNKVEG